MGHRDVGAACAARMAVLQKELQVVSRDSEAFLLATAAALALRPATVADCEAGAPLRLPRPTDDLTDS